jgi:hypothetical protein
MKKNKLKYFVLLGFVLALFACQKHEIEVAPAQLAPVSNLKHTLTGDTVLLSWTLPPGRDSLNVFVYEGASLKSTTLNTTSYKFGIVETNKKYVYTVKLSDTKGNTSLGELVSFTREGAAPIKNVSGEQNDNGVLVKWTTPDMPVSKITIKIGNQTVDVAPSATSYQFTNVPVGSYMISFVTTNSSNQTSNTVYLPLKVGATAVAYIGVYSDSTTLLTTGDEDEVAGAKWLFKNYSRSRYISFSQIKNGSVDLSQYRVLWWNYDLETTNTLPAAAADPAVVAKINAWYKGGGGLLLNQFAIQYLWTLGRMTDAYPLAVGSGAGFNNPDTWGIGVNIGKKHDQSAHPLFRDIAKTTQGDGRVTFPIIGPGLKEDHNYVIVNIPDFLKLGPNDNEAAYNKFVGDNNLEWLGQWDGIGDFWMCGIMELKPKNDFQGTALAIGIGGIEFNQDSGNPYQANIEKLYKNAIDYLKTK